MFFLAIIFYHGKSMYVPLSAKRRSRFRFSSTLRSVDENDSDVPAATDQFSYLIGISTGNTLLS